MNQEKLNGIASWANAWASCGTHPGLACGIWRNGKEVHYCECNHKGSNMISRNALYRIYSMTKPITIVAALILVERGLLFLDDPLEKYIPSFANPQVFTGGTVEEPEVIPAKRSITVKDLMMHTSGITYLFGTSVPDHIIKNQSKDETHWYHHTPLDVLCEYIAKAPLLFHPGEKWHYGFNTDILGRIIEIISEKSLDDFFRKEIFDPLGMSNTDFFVKDENKSRLVRCYAQGPGQTFIDITDFPERNRDIENKGKVLLSGGGGLVSSMDDYYKFAQCLLDYGNYTNSNGDVAQLLKKETVILMSTNHLPNNGELVDFSFDNSFSEAVGGGVGFGLGVSVITRPKEARGGEFSDVGEWGWGGVASTWFCVNPTKKMVCLLMTQIMPSTNFPVRTQFRYLAFAACEENNEDQNNE